MNEFTKKRWFVGIDISKDHLDVALLSEELSRTFKVMNYPNDPNGFERMLRWVTGQQVPLSESVFCMEHTGNYGLLLFAWLSDQGIDYCVLPGLEIKRSIGMSRGKNDKVDAQRIANYAARNKDKLTRFILPSKSLIQIKQLLTFREQTVKIRTSLKNSLKSHQQYNKISALEDVASDIQIQIEQQTDRIEKIELQIMKIIQSENNLDKNFALATSVKGIGLVIAAFMLVTTNNFTSFDNGRKYACYCGTAPFENTSGSSLKAKPTVSHLANKRLKTLLSNGANAAKSFDPEIRQYYERKKAEGKDHKLIINAISCKLINRVFSVINRGTPYVAIYAHNFG